MVKLGYVGVYLFFLFLLQNIDCGYSLEPPRRCGSNVYHNQCFEQICEKKKIKNFLLQYSIFYSRKISLYDIAWTSFHNDVAGIRSLYILSFAMMLILVGSGDL